MADLTIEQAITQRDTISPPRYIVDNILCNEGMDAYVDLACSRILELSDKHPECKNDIYLDIMNFNVQVTVFGFWLIKNILLIYITEEKWQEYMNYLRFRNELVQAQNNMIELLRGFNKKTLRKTLHDMKNEPADSDGQRIIGYLIAELRARSIRNRLWQRLTYLLERSKISLRAFKIIRSWLNNYCQQNNN